MGHLVTLFQKKMAIVRDNFNRADSALTMGNANTGQAWVPSSGTWGISSNQAYTTDTASVDITTIDTFISDSIISANIKFSSTEGIVFRFTDVNNHLLVRINSANIAIQKDVANVLTSLGSFSFTPVVGTLYNVKAICIGSSIRIFLDGVLRITVVETFNQTATKSGLRTGASIAGRFDDFLVEAL